jgi:hypothetical protein
MRTFNGFFSYAHIDAKVSPSLIKALTIELERLVSAKLINAELSIFYDVTRLHAGDRWDPTIDKALRQSDILIVLFTPSWIQSDYCRKEYLVFEEVERSYGGGGYVVPILARPIGGQEQHLTSEQRLVHDALKDRQYFPMLASDFLLLDENPRQKALEEVGDDIVGILERRRDWPGAHPQAKGRCRQGERRQSGDISAVFRILKRLTLFQMKKS